MSKSLLRTPALSCDAMLDMTKVEVECIPDPDMYLFFGKGMRGRVSCTSKRYGKAKKTYFKIL